MREFPGRFSFRHGRIEQVQPVLKPIHWLVARNYSLDQRLYFLMMALNRRD